MVDGYAQIFPSGRTSRSVGPGIELQQNSGGQRRRDHDQDRVLDAMTSLE